MLPPTSFPPPLAPVDEQTDAFGGGFLVEYPDGARSGRVARDARQALGVGVEQVDLLVESFPRMFTRGVFVVVAGKAPVDMKARYSPVGETRAVWNAVFSAETCVP